MVWKKSKIVLIELWFNVMEEISSSSDPSYIITTLSSVRCFMIVTIPNLSRWFINKTHSDSRKTRRATFFASNSIVCPSTRRIVSWNSYFTSRRFKLKVSQHKKWRHWKSQTIFFHSLNFNFLCPRSFIPHMRCSRKTHFLFSLEADSNWVRSCAWVMKISHRGEESWWTPNSIVWGLLFFLSIWQIWMEIWIFREEDSMTLEP